MNHKHLVSVFSLLCWVASSFGSVYISGLVLDSAGDPVSGAKVSVWNASLFAISGQNGAFAIEETDAEFVSRNKFNTLHRPSILLSNRNLVVTDAGDIWFHASVFDLRGKEVLGGRARRELRLPIAGLGAGMVIVRIETALAVYASRVVLGGNTGVREGSFIVGERRSVSRAQAISWYVQASKDQYVSQRVPLKSDTASGLVLKLETPTGQLSPVDYVDPFIGTEVDFGQLYPGPSSPWGFAKPGPDTDPGSHVGYDFSATRIKGFSQTRIGGVGCDGAGGNILVKPGVGDIYSATNMDKTSETATPGYYSVALPDLGIKAELTSLGRAAFHRYTFPASSKSFIHLDLRHCYGGCCYDPEYAVIGDSVVVGKVSGANPCCIGKYSFYFSALFSRKFESVTRQSDNLTLNFSTKQNDTILVKIGLSPVSFDHATAACSEDAESWSFDSLRAAARELWNSVLGTIEVTGDEEFKTLFYTHMYRSHLSPVNTVPKEGTYSGTDCQLHRSDRPHYNSWSIWDTFRSKYPLLTLVQPSKLQDMVQSLTLLYQQGKTSGGGPCEPVPTVRTEHTLGVIVDAYEKGLRNFDTTAAYEGIRNDARKHEFEKAWNYWCIAQMAKGLGKTTDYDTFMVKAAAWKELWLNDFKNVMGDSSAAIVGSGGYEGTKWQYRWFAPHDVQGIINLVGSRRKFVEELEHFFEHDYYNHGNEPALQAPYLFVYAGKPALTQKWVRRILTEPMTQRYGTHDFFDTPYVGRIYKTTPDGYIPEMDDDVGTMAAWFVLSSLGIYQSCVGRPVFEIGTPLFEKTVIHLDPELHGNRTFTILANGLSDNAYYISSAKLNNTQLDRAWLSYQEIVSGGTLELQMSTEPSSTWAVSDSSLPPSMSVGE